VTADGTKVVLGLWIKQNEGAKFWLRVMNELKNRGVEDIMLAVIDGLKGFPDAITAAFPEAIVQTCIVHLLRNSMDFVSWKHRKPLAGALTGICRAVDAKSAKEALTAFETSEWGQRYPAITGSMRPVCSTARSMVTGLLPTSPNSSCRRFHRVMWSSWTISAATRGRPHNATPRPHGNASANCSTPSKQDRV